MTADAHKVIIKVQEHNYSDSMLVVNVHVKGDTCMYWVLASFITPSDSVITRAVSGIKVGGRISQGGCRVLMLSLIHI